MRWTGLRKSLLMRRITMQSKGDSVHTGNSSPVAVQERYALEVLAAANRLMEKYPVLREHNHAVDTIRPRYAALCEEVAMKDLDRKGSFIGGMPFISRSYPGLDYWAPLAQFNLDQISEAIAEDVGSGLLQVWMVPGHWGQIPHLGAHGIVVIPRNSVDRTRVILDHPECPGGEWLASRKADIDAFEGRTVKDEKRVHRQHYWDGVNGLDWTFSEFAPVIDWHSSEIKGAPQQIVGWEAAGYTIPIGSLDGALWEIDEGVCEEFPGLDDDADYKLVFKACNKYREPLRCALFEVYYDFFATIYGSEIFYDDEALNWDWKPLVAFSGPISRVVSDDHMIFYRRVADGFEYSGAICRWNW